MNRHFVGPGIRRLSFVLVHSPLIGPYSWQPVASYLQHKGYQTVVPSLLPVLEKSLHFADAIAQNVSEAVNASPVTDALVLVGHSAAGSYLPVISSWLDRKVHAYVFVDARLPRRGASLADDDSREESDGRRGMAENGLLPPWSKWFAEEVMREIIPDDERRKRFLAELQPIPLALFDEKIFFSSAWPDAPCVYVRLSEFYQPLAQEASARGWPVVELDAQHLYLLANPPEVGDILLEIVDHLESHQKLDE